MTTEERLEKLEKELSWARWLLAGAALCVGIGVIVWTFAPGTALAQVLIPGVQKVVRANSFVLVDENGRERGGMRVFLNTPSLDLSDENGKTRVMLSLDKNEPRLYLYGEGGLVRASLSILKNQAHLWLIDVDGEVLWSAP